MKAIDVINKTATLYHKSRFNFDINIIPFLSDPIVRQDIVRITTGKKLPTKLCTISFTANQLKAHFETPKLF